MSDGDGDNPRDPDGNPDPDKSDTDDDSRTPESYGYPDRDDRSTLAYGHSPASTDRRAIARVLASYYAAAAVADGASACKFLTPLLAGGAATPHNRAGGAGDTCATVLSSAFRRSRRELSGGYRLLKVGVHGSIAQVVVGSSTMLASFLYLERRGGTWKVAQLFASPLP